jgi:hypothetical protein
VPALRLAAVAALYVLRAVLAPSGSFRACATWRWAREGSGRVGLFPLND